MNVIFTTSVVVFTLLNLQTILVSGTLPSGHTKYVSSSLVSKFKKKSIEETVNTIFIERNSDEICQARVDFLTFNVGKVDPSGYCFEGAWKASGQVETNVPTLCGENTGQHVYLNFLNDDPITLTVHTDNPDNDDWEFQITQIACDDQENIAELGCLQYFKEWSGEFKSFNFKKLIFIEDPPDTYQLANQNYNICIGAAASSFDSVTYRKADDASIYYFALNGNIKLISRSAAGTGAAADFDYDCYYYSSTSNDFIEILGGEFLDPYGSNLQYANMFCGLGFPDEVHSTNKPFKVHVVTDSFESSGEGSTGFNLRYYLN